MTSSRLFHRPRLAGALFLLLAGLAAAHHADPRQGAPWYIPPGAPQPSTTQAP